MMTERDYFLLNKWSNVIYRLAKIGNWRIKRGQPPEATRLDASLKINRPGGGK